MDFKKIFINDEGVVIAIHDLEQNMDYAFTEMFVVDKGVEIKDTFIPVYEDFMNTLRYLRNKKLEETDWLVGNEDVLLANKIDIINYREALRNLPEQYTSIESFAEGYKFPDVVQPVKLEASEKEKEVLFKNKVLLLEEFLEHPTDLFPGKLFLYNFNDYLYIRYKDGTYTKIK